MAQDRPFQRVVVVRLFTGSWYKISARVLRGVLSALRVQYEDLSVRVSSQSLFSSSAAYARSLFKFIVVLLI